MRAFVERVQFSENNDLQERTLIDSKLLVDNICNQGYHIIDNFLEVENYLALGNHLHFLNQENALNIARIGSNEEVQNNQNIRNDKILWLDEDSEHPFITNYLNALSSVANILNQTLFLGLSEVESHFATYESGSFYKKHIDQFRTNKRRKISCVYYLNQNWQKEYGGELNLYTNQDELLKTVNPQGNRFICFTSDIPHEVCVTHQTRYSIAGWLKSR